MSTHGTLTELFTDTADAIREKKGTSDPIVADNFPEEIRNLPTGGSEDGLRDFINGEITDFTVPDGTTVLRDYVLYYVSTLTSLNTNSVTEIGSCAAMNCLGLTELNMPEATVISSNAFATCTKLASFSAPKAEEIQSMAFRLCTGLTQAVLPKAKTIATSAFYNCTKLAFVDTSCAELIQAQAFSGCSALDTLILRRTDAIATLGSTNALNNTTIAKGEGYIYVPQALLEEYLADSVWSTYAEKFRAIEDYPDITG